MKPEAHGIVRNGQIELIDPLDLPEGTEVVVTPLAPQGKQEAGQMLRRGMYRGEKSVTLKDFKAIRREWEGELDEFFGSR